MGNKAIGIAMSMTAESDPAAITASDPSSPTAYTAPAPGGAVTVTSQAATDLDDAAAALQTLVGEVGAIRDEVVKTIDDISAIRTTLTSLMAKLRTAGYLDS